MQLHKPQRDSCPLAGLCGPPRAPAPSSELRLLGGDSARLRGRGVAGMAPRRGNAAPAASSRLLPEGKSVLAACGAQRLSGSPWQRCGPAMAGAAAAGARYGTETNERRRLRQAGLGAAPGLAPDPRTGAAWPPGRIFWLRQSFCSKP